MYVTTQLSHTHETEARACRSATRISLSRTHIAQPHAYRSAARMSLSHTHVPRMSHTGTLKEAAADGTRKVAVERERAAKKLASAVETYGVLQVELAQARQELAERQEGTCPVSRVVELQEQLSRVHREREQQAKEAKVARGGLLKAKGELSRWTQRSGVAEVVQAVEEAHAQLGRIQETLCQARDASKPERAHRVDATVASLTKLSSHLAFALAGLQLGYGPQHSALPPQQQPGQAGARLGPPPTYHHPEGAARVADGSSSSDANASANAPAPTLASKPLTLRVHSYNPRPHMHLGESRLGSNLGPNEILDDGGPGGRGHQLQAGAGNGRLTVVAVEGTGRSTHSRVPLNDERADESARQTLPSRRHPAEAPLVAGREEGGVQRGVPAGRKIRARGRQGGHEVEREAQLDFVRRTKSEATLSLPPLVSW